MVAKNVRQKGSSANSPWYILIGILCTTNPSATLTRGPPPLSGEVSPGAPERGAGRPKGPDLCDAQAPCKRATAVRRLLASRRGVCGRHSRSYKILGEYAQSPLASPGGVAERSESFNNNDCRWQSYLDLTAGSPLGLTEEGWRQLKNCLHSVQWYQLKVITVYLPLFRFIYHTGERFL